MVKICVTGCLHGELDRVYKDIAAAEQYGQFKTDLVLCCGDFQSVRNPSDLASMSIPPKYYRMGDFWRYYAEESHAPILTLFVGGNHEASGYLQELPYGGWVAPNIWYMGYAGVVQYAGLRIAGISGIYKQHDYTMCHYEHPPYSEATKRSVYHLRNLEVFRLGQIRRRLDIVLSHDWPRGIYRYGDTKQLTRMKPHFHNEVDTDSLGNPPGEQLFCRLRPRYWFSAHLHCKFAAVVQHNDPHSSQTRLTRFLALDKCLPNRGYLQFVDIEAELNRTEKDSSDLQSDKSDSLISQLNDDDPVIVSLPKSQTVDSKCSTHSEPENENQDTNLGNLFLDPEWLCILRSTNHLMSTSKVPCILPEKETHERCDFSVSESEIQSLYETFGNEFRIPDNFERTAPIYKSEELNDQESNNNQHHVTPQTLVQQANRASKEQQHIFSNPQTELICAMLDLLNPNAALLGKESYSLRELSAQLQARNVEDDEDEESCSEEEQEAKEHTGNITKDSEQSWISTKQESEEYDPLNSAFNSVLENDHELKLFDNTNTRNTRISRNPEELLIDNFDDDNEEDEQDHENISESGTANNLLPEILHTQQAYIP